MGSGENLTASNETAADETSTDETAIYDTVIDETATDETATVEIATKEMDKWNKTNCGKEEFEYYDNGDYEGLWDSEDYEGKEIFLFRFNILLTVNKYSYSGSSDPKQNSTSADPAAFTSCKPCDCDQKGSKTNSCGDHGQCDCK